MSVRSKLQLQEVRQHCYSPTLRTLIFRVMYDQSIPEDQRFYDATPSGEFTVAVNNPKALEQLELGKYYYLNLTPVEQPTT